MAVALSMLAKGEGDAVVSAGSTGAFLTGATLIVKRIRGIRRAALTPIVPNAKSGSVLIDCGANVECTSENLYQFAFMGSLYAEHYMGINKPRIALINNGAEETKGTEVYVETHRLLKEAHNNGEINFVGNVEGRDVPQGVCDVIVADGF
ncbi:MAG: phosphate--acyl-ACP acyltransferase, partial [Clostridia bacterium]|nr:phosphate--acyl-ACP acyltransferase [Clostridia bacterium]